MKLVLALTLANLINAKTSCYCQEVCKLWGDPHVKTFDDFNSYIKVTDKENFIILKVDKFVVSALVDSRGYMKEIDWGSSKWTVEDCRGIQGKLPSKVYNVGNVKLIGEFSCNFKKDTKKWLHLDLNIKKIVNGDKENVKIEGACTK
jgi:hypothetical protein